MSNPTATPRDPRLAKLHAALRDAVAGASGEELTARPAEGKWSGAEVLEHLRLSYTGTVKAFDRLLAAGTPTASPLTLRDRIGQFVVITLGRIPGGRDAPKPTVPRAMPDSATIVSETLAQLNTMDGKIAEAAARFGTRQRVLDHPVLRALNIEGWRKFHLVHGQHHAKQVRERIAAARQQRRASAASTT